MSLMKKQSLILSSIVLIFFISTSFSNSFDFGETMVVSGKASIIDGDTIRINKKKIRLYGIDALNLNKHVDGCLEVVVKNQNGY